MKLIRKTLPGFTLIELIMVMALTTIIVLTGYTGILNLQNLLMKVRDNAGKDRTVYLLQNAMENDFRDAEIISREDGLNVKKKEETVRYRFGNSFLIRDTPFATDTFHFKISGLFISGVEGNDSLVEEISFNLSDDIQQYKMSFLKKYPEYKVWEFKTYGN